MKVAVTVMIKKDREKLHKILLKVLHFLSTILYSSKDICDNPSSNFVLSF